MLGSGAQQSGPVARANVPVLFQILFACRFLEY